jgi:hypothetical protein
MASVERRVILVGDPGVRRYTARRGYQPFINRCKPPFFGHTSFEQSVTDWGWEEVQDLLGTTQTTLKRRALGALKRIRRIKLHITHVHRSASFKSFRPYGCCPSTTVVVFCFSIEDERSFEDIKNKVNCPLPSRTLNNELGLQITRANALVRFSGTPKFGTSSRVFQCCFLV